VSDDDFTNTCRVCGLRLQLVMLKDNVGRRTSEFAYLHRGVDGPQDHEPQPRWVRDDG